MCLFGLYNFLGFSMLFRIKWRQQNRMFIAFVCSFRASCMPSFLIVTRWSGGCFLRRAIVCWSRRFHRRQYDVDVIVGRSGRSAFIVHENCYCISVCCVISHRVVEFVELSDPLVCRQRRRLCWSRPRFSRPTELRSKTSHHTHTAQHSTAAARSPNRK